MEPLKMPSALTAVAGLVLGVLAALNTLSFHFGPPWTTGINIALILGAAYGVAPLLGSAWRTALNLPHSVTNIIVGALAALQLWQQSEPISTGLHAAIAGVLAFAAALGFATNIAPAGAPVQDPKAVTARGRRLLVPTAVLLIVVGPVVLLVLIV